MKLDLSFHVHLPMVRLPTTPCKVMPLCMVCQGLLHMLGGEYVNYNQPTGKYSRKIITQTQCYNQWNECYPPMKTGSASPAVVN